MVDKSTAFVSSFFPNTTKTLPALLLPIGSAPGAPITKSSKPSPLTSPAEDTEGKSYVVFGKKDNTNAVNFKATRARFYG
jgi:hypothetical protein